MLMFTGIGMSLLSSSTGIGMSLLSSSTVLRINMYIIEVIIDGVLSTGYLSRL